MSLPLSQKDIQTVNSVLHKNFTKTALKRVVWRGSRLVVVKDDHKKSKEVLAGEIATIIDDIIDTLNNDEFSFQAAAKGTVITFTKASSKPVLDGDSRVMNDQLPAAAQKLKESGEVGDDEEIDLGAEVSKEEAEKAEAEETDDPESLKDGELEQTTDVVQGDVVAGAASGGKKILIISSEPENFVPQELKKKAESLGHTAEIINPDECYIGIDGEAPYISHNGTKFTKEDFDVCIPRLWEENLEYKVAILNHIERMGIVMVNSTDSMLFAIDKLRSQIELAGAGIKMPKCAMMTSMEQIDYVATYFDNTYPLVIKTLYGSGGVGVALVDSEQSFRSVCQLLIDSKVKFLVQEYIEHESSLRIILLNGELLAANKRSKNGHDFRTNSHQGSDTEKYEPNQTEMTFAKKVADIAGLRLVAVDYVIDNGELVCFEVNGSPRT